MAAAALAGLLLAYSAATNRPGCERWYVARNAAAGAALLVAGLAGGLDAAALGLAGPAVARGLAVGGLAAGAVTAAVAALARLGHGWAPVRALLADRRADLAPRTVAWHGLVRIPVGTAAFEELAFRGVLLALLLRAAGPAAAVAGSSLVFGLWHIPPTLTALRLNRAAHRRGRRVAGAVAVTAAAGAALAWLRLATGSLVAPVLVHWAANAAGLVAAAGWQRCAGERR